MDYTELVLAIRAKMNISQVELAEKMGVSFSTVNRWENGKTIPHKKELYRLKEFAKEIGINTEDAQ